MNIIKLIKHHLIVIFLLLVGLIFSSGQVQAEPIQGKHSSIDVAVPLSKSVAAGDIIPVTITIKAEDGWHTLWKNPGLGGKALTIKWKKGNGLEPQAIEFPAPTLQEYSGGYNYGYASEVTLLTGLKATEAINESITISGTAKWASCSAQSCSSERAKIKLTVDPINIDADPTASAQLAAIQAQMPVAKDWVAEFQVENTSIKTGIVPPSEAGEINDAHLYIENRKLNSFNNQVMTFLPGGIGFFFTGTERSADIQSSSAILSYTDDKGAIQNVLLNLVKAEGTMAAMQDTGPADGSTYDGDLNWATALLFAFLGGIILNFMPCVFPILSMKALSIVKMSGQDRSLARQSGLLYTIGILVAFVAIATVMVVLKQANDAIGWGFQMQAAWVNLGLAFLMVLVAYNLFGLFEVGTSMAGVGQELTQKGEKRASFFTGLLAVVVATPCSAPFMAGAIGYAIAQPPVITISIFVFLGLGLAVPYLLVSYIPAIGNKLPKPGVWMNDFKHILAFPMLATALWLFWIFGKMVGVYSMAFGILGALLLGLAFWAWEKRNHRPYKKTLAVVALLSVIGTGLSIKESLNPSTDKLGMIPLEHFSPDLVDSYIKAGQPTFVYFTADWCVSCKVNERVALASDSVGEYFLANNIKLVEGDWTAGDPVITEWLEKYNRAGVPLYLYFPNGAESVDTAVVLPQILFPDTVISAINEANSGVVPVDKTAADWSKVQEYIDLDTVWHDIDNQVRKAATSREEYNTMRDAQAGPHPDIAEAVIAANAILDGAEDHPKRLDSAQFLVDHTPGTDNYEAHMVRGVEIVFEMNAGGAEWKRILPHMHRYTDSENPTYTAFLDKFTDEIQDPVLNAMARYFKIQRLVLTASDPKLTDKKRNGLLADATALTETLSLGVEEEKMSMGRRGEVTFAELQKSVMYNINNSVIGRKLPETVAMDVSGKEDRISNYQGKIVLVDFWATWCGPCVRAIPKLTEMVNDLPDDRFEIVSISVDEKLSTVTEFHKKKPMPWVNWHVGNKSELLKNWAIRAYPTYILLDEEGKIIAKTNYLDKTLIELIESKVNKES